MEHMREGKGVCLSLMPSRIDDLSDEIAALPWSTRCCVFDNLLEAFIVGQPVQATEKLLVIARSPLGAPILQPVHITTYHV